MNYLTLENITKHYGEKTLFEGVDLYVDKGDKIALVAKNGTGKSTLLKVIYGEESSEGETAKVMLHKDVRMGMLLQDPKLPQDANVMEAVFDSDTPAIQAIKRYERAMIFPENQEEMQAAIAEMETHKAWDYEARIKEILSRFNISDLNQRIHELSGGQQKRVALAKVLIEEPDFLILDEPTNHLDLDMIEWLEEYLQSPNLTVFMITHDRYFLDRVCNVIYELDRGQLFRYRGNYSYFLEKKAAREENTVANLEKNKKLYKRELDWVRRSPQARGTKAKARVDAFYDIKDKVSVNLSEGEVKMDFKAQRMGKKILEAHNVSKRFGDLTIVEKFDYKFKKRERVGLVGANGTGKSTIINILTQQLKPDTGKIVVGDTIVFGHYAQDGMQLNEDKRVIEVIKDIAEVIPLANGKNLTAASFLERFLFDRKQQQVYVSQLSGGEKRRLYLMTVLMANPNFLILDEPTNDLDILTLNVLEDFLQEYQGCLLVVTHDRYFMDKLVDHLFILEGDGEIRDYNGTYSEYRAMKREEELEAQRMARESQPKEKKVRSDKTGLDYEQRKELNRLEKEIMKLEEKKLKLSEKFNDTSLSADDITQLSIEIGEIQNKLEEKEMRWMELGELM